MILILAFFFFSLPQEALNEAKDREDFEECLRLQRGMKRLEPLRDELKACGDDDDATRERLVGRITAACNALKLEPQDENTDL
jgi:hypothetical protein